MRVAQARPLVHFQMQLDEQAPFVVVRGKFVNGEAAALGDGANGFEERLVVARARLDVDDHVGGNDGLDVALDRFAGRVRLLEARRARHADGDVDEIALAPARRTRTRSVCSTPSVSSTALVICSRKPRGATSSSASTVWRPRREPIQMITPATVSAAIASSS